MANLSSIVENSFRTYAGMVIADRAIVDVRDCIKPSPRVLLYNQYKMKNIFSKGFVKSPAVVGEALKTFYYHGDSSCYAMYCRMAAPFAMRYPLVAFQGNCGTLKKTGDAAAMRYTEMKLSEVATNYLFAGLNKNAIAEWRDNFDETDKSPTCLPSIGFYNIVNGSIGLGIAISSSIPQFNLKEVNNAIIRLIKDPNASADSLICMPDFATGGYLLNPAEVRNSLREGHGKAAKLRAVINYDAKGNAFHITELPYSVYTDTIFGEKGELVRWLEEEPECGIKGWSDSTGGQPDIIIYLNNGVNPSSMLKQLYAKTSLETSYSINMTMLDHGRFPRIFGWKDALQAYIDHIRECKRRELEYDFNKLKARNHILDGLLTAIADIDETIHIIKSSASSAAAKAALMRHYDIDEDQAKAILDIKLARLAHLEALELESERKQNQLEIDRLSDILSHQDKFDEILISILQEVADKFGDERRTKILTIAEEPEEEIEEKEINVNIAGDKLRINPKKVAGQNISTTNLGTLVCVSSTGLLYKISMRDVEEGKTYSVSQLTKAADAIVGIYDLSNINLNKYWVFITKNGLIKKSPVKEYNYVGRQGTKMLKLKDDDAVIAVYLLSGDKDMISVHTSDKFYAHYSGQEIPESGKAAMGVKAINLGANQTIIKAQLNPTGLKITGRAVKGVKE